MTRPLEERFWENVHKTETHWIWTRPSTNNGYGAFTHEGKRYVAHRLAYELLVGPIPDGLVIDHLCRVKRCVNPDHLEAVTLAENSARNTAQWECFVGHRDPRLVPRPFTGLWSLSVTCTACDAEVSEILAPYLGKPKLRSTR